MPETEEMIRVLVADDHRIFSQGLCALLTDAPFDVVGEADTGETAVELVRALHPDVVVMDVSMPDLNGIEATRQITAESSRWVIALSMLDDTQAVRDMLEAGASGYVLKDCAFAELTHAIRAVAAGQHYLSSAITGGVVNALKKCKAAERASPLGELTKRQREILKLLAEGYTAQGIADTLGLSVKTVHTHRDRIMDKLQTRSIAELNKIAVRNGLITL